MFHVLKLNISNAEFIPYSYLCQSRGDSFEHKQDIYSRNVNKTENGKTKTKT